MKHVLVVIVVVSFALAACGTSSTCDAKSCASGCCDSSGSCRPGTAQSACGKGGASCAACDSAQSCQLQACSGGAGGGSAGGGSAGGAAGGSGGSGGGASSSSVVFNEICARSGGEYVELYNNGATAKDLSGYGFSDSLPDGGPYASRATLFPASTMLASHGFLLIMLGRTDAGASTDCGDAGATSCFEATFNVSNSAGETVWLLDSTGAVEVQTAYPINGHGSGRSYGRIPDGTGAFADTARTPGVANAP